MVVRRAYAGGAVPTTLSAGINTIVTAASVTALTGYPSGAQKWYAVIDRDLPTEEKVLVTNVSGFNLTIERGKDGTTAQDHSAGAVLEHCFTAVDADEANFHTSSDIEVHGIPVGAAVVGTTGVQTLEDKLIDGVANTFTNIPTSASPLIMAAVAAVQAEVDAEEIARLSGDNNRWTKAEADDRFVMVAGDSMTGWLTLSADPTNDLHAATKRYVDEQVPIGSVTMWAGDDPLVTPTGWMTCDGGAISRAAYPDLFAAIGVAYGPGDGVTTFNKPDFGSRGPRHADGVVINNGDTGGAESVTLIEANLPPHVHDIAHEHNVLYGGGSGGATRRLVSTADFTSSASLSSQTTITPDADSGAGAGASTPFSTMDPWLGIRFIIRAE